MIRQQTKTKMNLAKFRREYKEASIWRQSWYVDLEEVRSRMDITGNLFSDKDDGFVKNPRTQSARA